MSPAKQPAMTPAASVVRVHKARGFVVESPRRGRLIITAAHVLPHLPPAHAANGINELLYPRIAGPLGGRATVSLECLFVDPVADIAVLCVPDEQVAPGLAERCGVWLDTLRPLAIGEGPMRRVFDSKSRTVRGGEAIPARVLSLKAQWFGCVAASVAGRTLWLDKFAEPIRGGMSGSPILDGDGRAIGVISTGTGPNPKLPDTVPTWLVEALEVKG
jgi:hypothetical protein